ncbi:MAG: S-layer homology domain-containing protein [Clostridia bacterium]|nr:S-layer homology domain-containing protein [Clostridia bacterium]
MINKLFKRTLFLAVFTLLFSTIIGMTVFGAEPYTILSGDLNTVGSTVKIGDEEFYVIGKEDPTHIKLFAKYNLLVGNGITSPTNKQDSTALGFNSNTGTPYPATVPFVDSTDSIGYWMELKGQNLLYLKSAYGTETPAYVYDDNATIKTYVDDYVTYLKTLGVNVTGRLISRDELIELGCSDETKCENAPEWVYSTSYWTGTAVESEMLCVVYTNGEFNKNYFGNKNNFGVRPVIILDISTETPTQISSIEITGVKAPTVGGTPKYDDFTVETEGVTSYTPEVNWLYKDPENDDGYWHSYTNATFEAGKMYAVSIFLIPSGESYQFADISSLTVTVNGNKPDDVYESTTNVSGIRVQYVFGLLNNVPTTYTVNVNAVDKVDSEALETAKISLLKDNSAIDSWNSTTSVHQISGLESGEYTLKVTEAPEGYLTPSDITFTIANDGTITTTGNTTTDESGNKTFIFEFEKTKIQVKAVKESDNSALASVKIQILDSESNLRESWNSTNENHFVEGLITGKEYTIKVTEVPTGYEIPANITFTIATDGKVTTTGDMTNEGVLLVSILEVVTPTTYTVSYDVNGGTVHGGELTTRTVASGDSFTITKIFQMPDEDYHITVHPPEDKWFDAFEVSGERYERGAKITITGDTVIKYLWKDITYIDKVELTIEAPIVGTKIEGEYNETLGKIDSESITVRPVVTLPEGVDYTILSGEYYWTVSGEYTPYIGEIEAGKVYNASIFVYCEDDSYQFLEEGLEVVVNGEETTNFKSFGFWVDVYYPMEAVSKYLLRVNIGEGVGNISVVPSGEEPNFEYPITSVAYLQNAGTKWLLTAKPKEDYKFVKWTISGDDTFSNTNSQITIELTEDVEYLANFELIEYNVTYDANGGTGTMSGETSKYYIFPDCTYTAPTGKTFDKWEVNGKTYKVGDTLTLTEDILVKATWKNKSTSSGAGGSSSSSNYKITTKIENGTITPANASVKKNANKEFTFKANDGYEITDVLVDGKSVGVVNSYKLEKVTAKHTIEVKTAKVSAIQNVSDWAKEEMIKAGEKGLIPEIFAKKDASKAITRLEFATVAVRLYEAISGKKAEKATSNPFTDTSDEYVLKAYALGITKGTSEITFTPNAEITREQMATMVARALTKVGIDTTMDITNIKRFTDDNDLSDWGRPSVYFMAKEEIIKGIGNNRFNGLGNAKVEEAIAIALRSVEIFGK